MGNEWKYCPVCGTPLVSGHPSRCPSCPFIHWMNPVPGVVLVLADPFRRVLFGRRSAGQFREGLWCLPGGHVETGEDYMAAAVRESLEETGLTVVPSGLAAVYSNRFDGGRESLVVVLTASVPPGSEPRAGDDLDDLVWAAPGQPLPDLAFGADADVVRHFWAGTGGLARVSPGFFGLFRSQ